MYVGYSADVLRRTNNWIRYDTHCCDSGMDICDKWEI